MAEIPIDPRLVNPADTAFGDAVRAFMRTHAPSANTAHLRGELQGMVDAFATTSQDLEMQQLLHMLHTQYNLEGLLEREFLDILTANVAAYRQSLTARYVQHASRTTDSPYQEQSLKDESDRTNTSAANPTSDGYANPQGLSAATDNDSQSGESTTYIMVTPAEAAALEGENTASIRQTILDLARQRSLNMEHTITGVRPRTRRAAGDNSHQAGNTPTSDLPPLPRHHYPDEPNRCHPPGLAHGMQLKDKDYDWMYKCDLCGHGYRMFSEFQRHFRQQAGLRDGFRIVATDIGARVWYGVDASGSEYMGHLLYHPRGPGRTKHSTVPHPCGPRIALAQKASRLATIAKKKAAAKK
ncbi:hypothetical protein H2200_003467 [Cladophialophora chaetospira]|uniref:C2H2-type domain-containing protein n=1 Tax=Cladophialophora chaetospira TaxID=386627 RepID=A0AA38XHE8_9EURO|nr:hypothetical protein H2200_003467 [Cladophialophora chaetospira]